MVLLGIVALLAVPYLCGTLETMVLRERNAGHLNIYVTGLLSLFAYFLFSILVSLKLDFTFDKMRLMFVAGPAVLSVASIPVLIYKLKKGLLPKLPAFNREMLWFIPTAVIMGIVAFFLYEPSYLNDNTWEIVNTTLKTNTIYEFSSLTGKPLELALPIFTKIYVMPMFYAVMCRTFGFEMWLLAGILMPVIFYSLNLILVHSVSGLLPGMTNQRRRSLFMCIYLIYLMAGTYLSIDGITATTGYALLREGYSGYALTYGVLVPFVLYLLLKKKYLHAVFSGITFLGLIPLDKFFYIVLGTPIEFYTRLNTAGKLAALYLVAVIVLIALRILKKDKCPIVAFFLPVVTVCYCIVNLSDFLHGRKERTVFFVGIGIIMLAACGFRPMNDAENAPNIRKENTNLKACLSELSAERSITVWGTSEVMGQARRLSADVRLAYPRSVFVAELNGVEYDPVTDEMYEMEMFIRNKVYYLDYLVLERDDARIITEAVNDGVNCIILSGEEVREDFELLLFERGFDSKVIKYGYTVFLYDSGSIY